MVVRMVFLAVAVMAVVKVVIIAVLKANSKTGWQESKQKDTQSFEFINVTQLTSFFTVDQISSRRLAGKTLAA